MEEKKFSFNKLSEYNKTYNQMIKFLKKTIPEDSRPEIMQKFEDKAFEDDDRISGLKCMYRMNELATIVTIAAAMSGVTGAIGATLATGPYTAFYYFWCKHIMKSAKASKEDYLRFIKAVSEHENNVTYPFCIDDEDSLEKMQKYLQAYKKTKSGNAVDFISQLKLDEDKQMNDI